MEKAINSYKRALNTLFRLNTTSKEYDRLHHKVTGMEIILTSLDVNITDIQWEVYDLVHAKSA
jgi:hypothetical protein